jgi:hypothetical protein
MSLTLVHTTKQYCDFPHGRTFTDSDPVFPGRLDLIRSYEKYVKTHGLVCHQIPQKLIFT